MRSYLDLCGIARALDAVGERWALLVIRELMFGPKRFADLHRGLPGMSQNVLTQRLRELEQSGVLTRRHALPPVSGQVYELTEAGKALEPVLLALGRWGSPRPAAPGSASELSPDALVVALRTTFDPITAEGLTAAVQLRFPRDAFHVAVAGGNLDAHRGEADADAVLTSTVRSTQDLLFDRRDLREAMHAGDAHVQGDTALLRRFLTIFDDHR